MSEGSERSTLGYQLGLITFIRLTTLLRLSHYSVLIHPRYVFRAMLIVGTSIIATPLHVLEWLLFSRKIEATEITKPPIFIIGHWRSGTTHLHNLMCLDKRLGYLTMYQAIAPDCSLVGDRWLKFMLGKVLPSKRPMDNMLWDMETPQEEEVALCKMMPHSFYTQFIFPHKAMALFNRGVLLAGAPRRTHKEIQAKFRKLLKLMTLSCGGKQLVLKNPVNTARIALLLELFPDAKFVHIHRSPHEVFRSTRNLHKKLMSITSLQKLPEHGPDENILSLYKKLMQRYFEERHLIPEGNLVEVRYEDLEKNPLDQVRAIYERLELCGFEDVGQEIKRYFKSQSGYRKNQFCVDAQLQKKVERELAFAYEALGYPRGSAVRENRSSPTIAHSLYRPR